MKTSASVLALSAQCLLLSSALAQSVRQESDSKLFESSDSLPDLSSESMADVSMGNELSESMAVESMDMDLATLESGIYQIGFRSINPVTNKTHLRWLNQTETGFSFSAAPFAWEVKQTNEKDDADMDDSKGFHTDVQERQIDEVYQFLKYQDSDKALGVKRTNSSLDFVIEDPSNKKVITHFRVSPMKTKEDVYQLYHHYGSNYNLYIQIILTLKDGVMVEELKFTEAKQHAAEFEFFALPDGLLNN